MQTFIKLFGIVFIIISSTGVGFYYSYRLTSRCRDLRWYISAINHIRNKIMYGNAEICDAVLSIAGGERYLRIDKPFKVSLLKSGLNKSDEEMLYEFFDSVGSADAKTEAQRCEGVIKEAESRLAVYEEKAKQKCKISRMLGIFAGLAAAIILL